MFATTPWSTCVGVRFWASCAAALSVTVTPSCSQAVWRPSLSPPHPRSVCSRPLAFPCGSRMSFPNPTRKRAGVASGDLIGILLSL